MTKIFHSVGVVNKFTKMNEFNQVSVVTATSFYKWARMTSAIALLLTGDNLQSGEQQYWICTSRELRISRHVNPATTWSRQKCLLAGDILSVVFTCSLNTLSIRLHININLKNSHKYIKLWNIFNFKTQTDEGETHIPWLFLLLNPSSLGYWFWCQQFLTDSYFRTEEAYLLYTHKYSFL